MNDNEICPKCKNDNVKFRIRFTDDEDGKKYYVRINSTVHKLGKIMWFDSYQEAKEYIKKHFTNGYTFGETVEAVCRSCYTELPIKNKKTPPTKEKVCKALSEDWTIDYTDKDVDTKVIWVDGIELDKRAILNLFDDWVNRGKPELILTDWGNEE